MTSGEDAIVRLAGPARHAANNLAMVLLVNLESAAAGVPEGSREARQVSRALEAARAYDALARAVLGLVREERVARPRAGDYLAEILPLLSLAAGRRLVLDAAEAGVVLEVRRPALDAALVALAATMPAQAGTTLRLRGAALDLGWPIGDEFRVRLAAVGVEPGDEAMLHLPQAAAGP